MQDNNPYLSLAVV